MSARVKVPWERPSKRETLSAGDCPPQPQPSVIGGTLALWRER